MRRKFQNVQTGITQSHTQTNAPKLFKALVQFTYLRYVKDCLNWYKLTIWTEITIIIVANKYDVQVLQLLALQCLIGV